jgi:alkaline phosphatase
MSTEGFEKISGMRRSYDGMLDEVGAPSNSVELRDAVEEYLGVELTEEQADLALRGLAGESLTHDQGQYPYPSNMLGLVLSTHTRVGWTTGNHTADWMMSTAVGPGAEMFGGVWENTSAFDKILSAYDLSHRNPVMTYEEAKRLMDQRQATALNAAVRQHPVA